MTIAAKSLRRKSTRAKSQAAKGAGKGAESAKPKTLAQINRWMEENAETVMKAARKNTLRLTGKEVL